MKDAGLQCEEALLFRLCRDVLFVMWSLYKPAFTQTLAVHLHVI